MKLGINSEWAEITKLSLLDFNGKRERTLYLKYLVLPTGHLLIIPKVIFRESRDGKIEGEGMVVVWWVGGSMNKNTINKCILCDKFN